MAVGGGNVSQQNAHTATSRAGSSWAAGASSVLRAPSVAGPPFPQVRVGRGRLSVRPRHGRCAAEAQTRDSQLGREARILAPPASANPGAHACARARARNSIHCASERAALSARVGARVCASACDHACARTPHPREPAAEVAGPLHAGEREGVTVAGRKTRKDSEPYAPRRTAGHGPTGTHHPPWVLSGWKAMRPRLHFKAPPVAGRRTRFGSGGPKEMRRCCKCLGGESDLPALQFRRRRKEHGSLDQQGCASAHEDVVFPVVEPILKREADDASDRL
jgi:hypothetical protein